MYDEVRLAFIDILFGFICLEDRRVMFCAKDEYSSIYSNNARGRFCAIFVTSEIIRVISFRSSGSLCYDDTIEKIKNNENIASTDFLTHILIRCRYRI